MKEIIFIDDFYWSNGFNIGTEVRSRFHIDWYHLLGFMISTIQQMMEYSRNSLQNIIYTITLLKKDMFHDITFSPTYTTTPDMEYMA